MADFINNSDNSKKQQDLENLLKEIADPTISVDNEEYYLKLHNIYSGNFRHLYSGIYTALRYIDKQSGNDGLSNLGILSESLLEIYEYCMVKSIYDGDEANFQFLKNVRKLYDHVNLEIARIEDARAESQTSFQECKRLSKSLEQQSKEISSISRNVKNSLKSVSKMQASVEKASAKVAETEDRVSSVQKDNVAILSIFSAVVTAVVASLGLAKATIDVLPKEKTHLLVFFLIMVAAFCYNVLRLLFGFMYKLTGNKNLNEPWSTDSVNRYFACIVVADFVAYILCHCIPFLEFLGSYGITFAW